jgi:hypothetical protein
MLGFGALGQFALGEGPSARGNAWLPPWSEPVRQRIAPALAIALIAAGEFVSFNTITSEAISADKWFVPLSEPVRVKPRLLEALQEVEPDNPFGLLQVETVSIDRWLAPLAEPVRHAREPRTTTAAQAFWGYVEAPPFGEIALIDRWLQPWSEPVRVKLALSAGAQAFWGYVEAAPFRETVSLDRWGYPWSEPVRLKPGLGVAYQLTPAPFWPLPISVMQGGGTSRRLDETARIARGDPGPPPTNLPRTAIRGLKKPGAPRQVEPEKKPPTFAEFLKNWRPPPFAADPALERKRVADQQPFVAPPPTRLPDFSRLDRVLAHAADEHDATQAVQKLLDAEEEDERQQQLFGRRET